MAFATPVIYTAQAYIAVDFSPSLTRSHYVEAFF
jgi:hypothetical protein